jgi:glycerol dehydrogenase
MFYKAIFPGKYLQGAGALSQLGQEAAGLGTRSLVIASATARHRYLDEILPSLPDATLVPFGGECCDHEIERLVTQGREARCDLVIGMGGGKVIDTAKAVAHELKARTAIVPTIASTDAPCSAVSVIYTPEGTVQRYLFVAHNPDLVLVDTAIIAEAPVRFLIAGMGDALSTWLEADSCRRSYAVNQCGGLGTLAAHTLTRLCYDTLLEYGMAAVLACKDQVVTPALEHVVEANTLLSGLGFESAGLASAHAIHNGLTQLSGTHPFYHGEKVTIGVLAGLFLADRPRGLINEVYSFCESVGLPTTLAEIGLPAVSDQLLLHIGEVACRDGETIHHEPAPVSPQAVAACLKAADSYGRARKETR